MRAYRRFWGKKTTFNTSFRRIGVEIASDRALERHEIRCTFRIIAVPIQIGDHNHESVRTEKETRLASIGEIIRAKSKEMVTREARG